MKQSILTLKYAKGKRVFAESTPINAFYVIRSGVAKLSSQNSALKTHVINLVNPGEILGNISDKHPVFPFDCTALTALDVCYVSKTMIPEFAIEDEWLYYRLLESCEISLHQLYLRIRNLLGLSAKNKVADTLLMLIKPFGTEIQQGIDLGSAVKRKDIAEISDNSTEGVVRILNEFSGNGLIAKKGSRIIIKDVMGLYKMVRSECCVDSVSLSKANCHISYTEL